MNRRSFTLMPLILPTLILAENKKNICEIESINLMTDKIIFKNKKSSLKANLTKKENEKILLDAMNKLLSNPYEEDLIELGMKILENDNDSPNMLNNQYTKNNEIVKIIIDSFMWIESNKLKLKAISFLDNEFLLKIIEKEYLEPTYKNYLMYLNLGVKINDIGARLTNTQKDKPYKLYYNLINNIKNEYIDIELILKSCFTEQGLIALSNNYSIKNALELFSLSKIYPTKSESLKSLFYAISDNTTIFDFLELKYNIANKQYILASANFENIYLIEKKEYQKRFMAEISFLGSKEAYSGGDLFKSWTLSTKSINAIIEINDRTDTDAILLNNIKNNIKIIAENLAMEYEKTGNKDNANFIRDKTKSLLKKTFFVSKNIKKTSL